MNSLKISKSFRLEEYKVLLFRLFLVYVFYFFARVLFTVYNFQAFKIDSIGEFLKLAYYGLAFDTTAILYTNSLFVVLSILPLFINTHKTYQRVLFYVYFVVNLIAMATNFLDFAYYPYNHARTMSSVYEVLQHETNKTTLFFIFLRDYWHIFLLYFITAAGWIFLYSKVKIKRQRVENRLGYILFSLLMLCLITSLAIGGIRGDFKKSTRPINLVDADRHVSRMELADVVLNTPFSIIRTWGINDFQKKNFVSNTYIQQNIQPIKQYTANPSTRPNVVIFIMESFGREYLGSFNKGTKIPGYRSYTPFLDSLAQNSMIYTSGYANGYKSIHAMASVLAGIPSFKTAYTSSYYPNQKTQSLVSILESEGYDTSFFHGAPNGSMGFLGFCTILGFNHYYGKTEYNNDADFDGTWAIWDEPFLQYMNRVLSSKKTPFMATIFTASSHDPYKVPEKYKGKFPIGTVNMHQCVGYSDNALRAFFNSAKKEPWFNNTIFILTGDHTNTSAYSEYQSPMKYHAVPILFYKPDNSLKGESDKIAQQIDIYPTLLDLIGYHKPFRSWGVSLMTKDSTVVPFFIGYSNTQYQFAQGNYICTFDGQKATGFFDKNDLELAHNLIAKRNAEMNKIEMNCQAFIQDYYERIIDHKLDPEAEESKYSPLK